MSDRSLHASNNTPWKSIEGLAQTANETPEFTPGTTTNALTDSTVSRRGFMALVSASMALTAAACRRPEQKLVPTAKSLQNATPGLPVYYASVYAQRNVAYGTLIKTREGRPIKVRGNDKHPVNKGTANAEMQASLLSLYDPDRIRRASIKVEKGSGSVHQQVSYGSAVDNVAQGIVDAKVSGKKVLLVLDEHCSPAYESLLNEFITNVVGKDSAVVAYMPAISRDRAAQATSAVLGLDRVIVPDLSKAKRIVSVDADFLGTDTLALYHTTRFASKRKPRPESPSMSHLTVVESNYSMTGMNADKRIKKSPAELESFLQDVLNALNGGNAGKDAADVASRLKKDAGESVVLAGYHLGTKAQALALLINEKIGAIGSGKIIDPNNALPNSGSKADGIRQAVAMLNNGQVGAVLFMDVNPEYSASREVRSALLNKDVKVRAAINLYHDETSELATVSIPAGHWLESWDTAQSFDGTVSVQQPVIAPMCDGIPSMHDTIMKIGKKVSEIQGQPAFLADTETYADYVKKMINVAFPGSQWNEVLQKGIILAAARAEAGTGVKGDAVSVVNGMPSASKTSQYLLTVPSSSLYDGRYANNGWLQELPCPVTKVTWDNVALISPLQAVKLGLTSDITEADVTMSQADITSQSARRVLKAFEKVNGMVVTISTVDKGAIELPVYVQPGLADDVIVTQLGYGRKSVGTEDTLVGVNAFVFGAGGYTAISGVQPTDRRHKIATTQNHHTLSEGFGDADAERNVARYLQLSEFTNDAALTSTFANIYNKPVNEKGDTLQKPLSIVSEYTYNGHKWGMVIDMSACTGCSSCIVACQSENNIPIVGKDQVLLGREMHWIRLDRYYTGPINEPTGAVLEPMLCQHCDNAPCENVCPVAATTHSPEGLNEMTYNRCVGTRYCLNNCPYKVRRFNFLNYKDERQPLDLVFNPEVSGRMRGIMEKCTFCVQRLHEAKWHARDNGRSQVLDGEAVTACQEACPAGAIIFGNTNDKTSVVAREKNRVAVDGKKDRGFRVLDEINTRPAITYLAKVVNDDKA